MTKTGARIADKILIRINPGKIDGSFPQFLSKMDATKILMS
jgi:hypothetical protein